MEAPVVWRWAAVLPTTTTRRAALAHPRQALASVRAGGPRRHGHATAPPLPTVRTMMMTTLRSTWHGGLVISCHPQRLLARHLHAVDWARRLPTARTVWTAAATPRPPAPAPAAWKSTAWWRTHRDGPSATVRRGALLQQHWLPLARSATTTSNAEAAATSSATPMAHETAQLQKQQKGTQVDDDYYSTTIDYEAELAWFEEKLQRMVTQQGPHDGEDGQLRHVADRPRLPFTGPMLPSPARFVAMLVAAANDGQTRVLRRAFELVEASRASHNRGILLALLEQASRLRQFDIMQKLLLRLHTMNDTQASMTPPSNDEVEPYLDQPLHANTQLNAVRLLIHEHAKTKDVESVIMDIAILVHWPRTAQSVIMKNVLIDLTTNTGLQPFITALKSIIQNKGYKFLPQFNDSIKVHPDVVAFIIQCVLRRKSGLELKSSEFTKALQLASLAKSYLEENHGDNYYLLVSLLDFYRQTKIKPASFQLLRKLENYNVRPALKVLEKGLSNLRLADMDAVLKKVRAKGERRISMSLYEVIAKNLAGENVSSYVTYFIKNVQTDYPELPISAQLVNITLSAYAAVRNVARATALFNLMQPKRSRLLSSSRLGEFCEGMPLCTANTETYDIYLNTLTSNLERLHKKRRTESARDDTFTAADLIDLGKKAFEIARDQYLIPQESTYNAIINLCLMGRDVGQAYIFFEQMKLAGFFPQQDLYNRLIDALRHIGNEKEAKTLEHERDVLQSAQADRSGSCRGRQASS